MTKKTKNCPIKANTRLGNSNALREYKQTITLNTMQREAPRATPGNSPRRRLSTFKKRQSRWKPLLCVQFVQTIARAEYIWHLYSVFYNFVGTPPRVENIRGGAKARDYQSSAAPCGFELLGTMTSL